MKIIAGELGGRQFDAPKLASVRPMSEKARGAIFNALGDISGLTVLDAFAGSGALSFEAVSRGALSALTIEKDARAQKTITKNSASLDLTKKVKLIKAGAGAWLETSDSTFDIVLLDPPYNNLQAELLKKLAARTNQGGVAVLSLPPDNDFNLSDSFELLSLKTYGDATLSFYRRNG